MPGENHRLTPSHWQHSHMHRPRTPNGRQKEKSLHGKAINRQFVLEDQDTLQREVHVCEPSQTDDSSYFRKLSEHQQTVN